MKLQILKPQPPVLNQHEVSTVQENRFHADLENQNQLLVFDVNVINHVGSDLLGFLGPRETSRSSSLSFLLVFILSPSCFPSCA